MVIDKARDIVADVENQPNRDEAGDAVEVDLREIANDISVEKAHQKLSNFEFRLQPDSQPAISKERRKKSFRFLGSCFP